VEQESAEEENADPDVSDRQGAAGLRACATTVTSPAYELTRVSNYTGDHVEELSEKFKALSEVVRLRIVDLLARNGELCVCDVEATLELSQSAASRHLRTLARAGLVVSRREGQWVHYRLAEPENPRLELLLDTVRALLDFERREIPDPRAGGHACTV